MISADFMHLLCCVSVFFRDAEIGELCQALAVTVCMCACKQMQAPQCHDISPIPCLSALHRLHVPLYSGGREDEIQLDK